MSRAETQSLLSPCVLVVKTPVVAREGVVERLGRTGRSLGREVTSAAREQELTLAAVHQALADLGVAPVVISIDSLDEQARRLIGGARLLVTVGGDGTLLSASHWVTGAAVLGVNSAPRSSVGYLALARRATVARILKRIERGTLLPKPVARLEAELDGQVLPPALNDVLVAHERPAATSRYQLRLGRQRAKHRSSGLWVSTATGSTAGIRSAGGRPMALTARRLQFRARELYRPYGQDVALESGFVPEDGELVVESAMEAGWLFPDGTRLAVPFPFGARATFRLAEQPLLLFADPERWLSSAARPSS
ncbi:MAG: NAD(+)/NADH kinase [Acidobacteriota bacterium]